MSNDPYAAARNLPTVKLLDRLLDFPSPPGREQEMAAFLQEYARNLGFPADIDAAGNVLVLASSTAADKSSPLQSFPRDTSGTIIAAHMDEIALVVSHVREDGTLKIVRSGGLFPKKMGERMVQILGDNETIEGVLSSGAGHGSDPYASLTWDDYWVITGLSKKQLTEKGIFAGTPIVPVRSGRGPFLFGDPENPFIAAWTFDDRMGVVTLLRLLDNLAKSPLTSDTPLLIAFTVHEEGGAHGAKFLNHQLNPGCFIAVDGCPLTPHTDANMFDGPAVWAKDGKTNYSHKILKAFTAAAQTTNTPIQRVIFETAFSDASSTYYVGGAPQIGTIGHPRENSHGFETAPLQIFQQVLTVLEEFVRSHLPCR